MYTNFSPKHFEWATEPKWEPYRDEITSFVPYNKKPAEGALCDKVKIQAIQGLFIKYLSVSNPFEYILKMLTKFPITAL